MGANSVRMIVLKVVMVSAQGPRQKYWEMYSRYCLLWRRATKTNWLELRLHILNAPNQGRIRVMNMSCLLKLPFAGGEIGVLVVLFRFRLWMKHLSCRLDY